MEERKVSVSFDTTFESLWKQTKGRGEVFPLDITFRTWPEESGWIEPGMRALLVDVVQYDAHSIQLYLYFRQHEGYNLPFFKKEFRVKTSDGKEKKVDAIESGHYESRTYVLLPKEFKVHEYLKIN